MALNKSLVSYDMKLTPAYLAHLKCVQEATAPAEWAESLYELLIMPRLASYIPDAPIPDLWVLVESSCLGMLQLSVDSNRKTLFDESNPFSKKEVLLVDHGKQQKLAETLYEYVYDQPEPFAQDMLLPVRNYKGEIPRYLVLHLFNQLQPMLGRYVPIVTVRTAKFPV